MPTAWGVMTMLTFFTRWERSYLGAVRRLSHAVAGKLQALIGGALRGAAFVPRKAAGDEKTAPFDAVSKYSPNGIRTRVTAVRGRRPRPLDDRAMAPGQRFELQ